MLSNVIILLFLALSVLKPVSAYCQQEEETASKEVQDSAEPGASIYDNLEGPTQGKDKVEQEVPGDFKNTAVLKIVDKKLGKMDVLHVSTKAPGLYHDEVVIKILACWSEEEDKLFKDHKALLEVYDVTKDGKLEKRISEWIFSKNPALSTHYGSRYEILLDHCYDK